MHRTLTLGLFGIGLATLSGCAALIGGGGGGAHRSAQFAAGNAPEPTIATTVLSCVAKALPYGSGDAYTAQFNALSRAAMPAAPVPLSPSTPASFATRSRRRTASTRSAKRPRPRRRRR